MLNFIDQKVLVLGGAGFIGSNLAIDLVKRGAIVTIIDNLHPECGGNMFNLNPIQNQIRFIQADISHLQILTEIVKDKDYIFNLAGQTSHPYSMQEPIEDAEINYIAVLNLLETCRKENPNVKIIYTSTRQIYGNQTQLPVPESASINPPDINAINNLAAEEAFKLYNKIYGIKYTILRLTNTFGPRITLNKPQAGFLARFIKEIIENKSIKLPKDYLIKRDLNYIDDVSEACMLSALSDKNETYNLGNNEILSIEDIGKFFIEANGSGELIYPDQPSLNGIGVNDIYLDFQKIKEDLNWSPKTNTIEAIKKTLNYYKLNQTKYTTNINFVNLKKKIQTIKPEIDLAINNVLKEGRFVLGKEVESFEKEFAHYSNTNFAIGVGNGAQALELCLKAFNIGPGDEVIVPANTSFFTIIPVVAIGATPIFIDCEEDSMTINPNKIEEKITEKTKAIIPVHFYGNPANMEPILEIGRKYNLKIIEDACQAHGAKYKGKTVGSIGDAGCFSFYETKNLGGFGDGGIITTNNPELYSKLKVLRNGGNKGGHVHEIFGINSRIDEIQAAVLRVQLKYLNSWTQRRREIAKQYNQQLKGIITPIERENDEHVYHLYVIKTKDRDALKEHLTKNNITALIHYPIPVHKQKAFGDTLINLYLPITEKINKEILSLPLYPEMTNEEVNKVIKVVNEFQNGRI
ncbi:MAG: DegT/DnrJ/EryC1/StrS family aminotransferase [Nanoarchaeota archaeon]|nr:DegT/DnrJ/EryC1/StrS family aminotransferase [Nanoarchaeota archaeon]